MLWNRGNEDKRPELTDYRNRCIFTWCCLIMLPTTFKPGEICNFNQVTVSFGCLSTVCHMPSTKELHTQNHYHLSPLS